MIPIQLQFAYNCWTVFEVSEELWNSLKTGSMEAVDRLERAMHLDFRLRLGAFEIHRLHEMPDEISIEVDFDDRLDCLWQHIPAKTWHAYWSHAGEADTLCCSVYDWFRKKFGQEFDPEDNRMRPLYDHPGFIPIVETLGKDRFQAHLAFSVRV